MMLSGRSISPAMYRAALLVCAGLLLLYFKAVPVWQATLDRQGPIEPDDAYSYIVKAAELSECFTQSCPALSDLKGQVLSAPATAQLMDSQYRVYQRTLLHYHPLHSVLLLSLHKAGLSWETALTALSTTGQLLAALAVPLFLCVAFGWREALWGTALVAISPLSGQEFMHMVPSSIALSVTLLTWAVVIRGGAWRRPVLWSGILAVLFMHLTGKVFAALTLALFVLTEPRPWDRRFYFHLLSLAVATLLVALLPYAFPYPAFVMFPDYFQSHVDLMGVQQNAIAALRYVGFTLSAGRDWPVLGLAALVGLIVCIHERRKTALILVALCLIAAAASLLAVMPGYPGAVFARFWVLATVVLFGLCGVALQFGFRQLFQVRRSRPSIRNAAAAALSLVLLLVVLRSIGGLFLGSYGNWSGVILLLTQRQEFDARPEQAYDLPLLAGQNQRIAYDSEELLYFFLSHGGLANGAVYLPVALDTANPDGLGTRAQQVDFAALSHPATLGQILITKAAPLTLDLYSESGKARLLVQNLRSKPARLLGQDIAPGASRLFEIAASEKVVLLAQAPDDRLALRGIYLKDDQPLHWPWGSRASLTRAGFAKPVIFDLAQFYPARLGRITPVDDRGPALLARIDGSAGQD